MSVKSVTDWCAGVLAISAIAIVGSSAGAQASTGAAPQNQDTSLEVSQGDLSVGYVVAGDLDSDGGGNPPRPE